MIAAQPSPPSSSSRPFPISASTRRPAPAPTRSGRLSVIFDPSCPSPFVFILLPALKLSCLSFSCPRPLFSIVCGLFCENTGGGIPLPDLHGSHLASHTSRPSCAKTQKRPPVSPLPATLTDSLSRKSFACHSCANTRDVGAAPSFSLAVSSLCSLRLCGRQSLSMSFRINTCISVASKRLYLPLESTLMKKGGRALLTGQVNS
jgi:hypothetical protein